MNDRVAVVLRMAPELHGRLKELAVQDGRSLNSFIGRTLSHYVARTPRPGPVVEVLPVPSKVRKVRPNEPCPCGSGSKYKRCHGRL